MTQSVQQALDAALKLSPEERELVLRERVARLDGQPEADAETRWAEEVERRIGAARAGAPAAGDWETVCDEVKAEVIRGR